MGILELPEPAEDAAAGDAEHTTASQCRLALRPPNPTGWFQERERMGLVVLAASSEFEGRGRAMRKMSEPSRHRAWHTVLCPGKTVMMDGDT